MARQVRVAASTGNVFRDVGFRREEAEHLLVRADLLIQVQKLIGGRRLKQREAAEILRMSQPRVVTSSEGASIVTTFVDSIGSSAARSSPMPRPTATR